MNGEGKEGGNADADVNCATCSLSTVIPVVAKLYPYRVSVPPGTVLRWCTCGRSASQPLCDGVGHVGTPFRPLVHQVRKDQPELLLCGCKYTQAPPYCDGSHVLVRKHPHHPPCRCHRDTSSRDPYSW